MKVVKVLWVDSCNSNMNWTVTEDIEIELMYIDSFGVVVKDSDEFLAIAQNYGDSPEQYSNITTIPKGCIKEVFVIHEDNVCENEQKPTNKIEPKFHEGDWIVYKNDICQIVKREEGCNKLVTNFGIDKELVNERNLSTARLWSIADAKDGDILAFDDETIVIFKDLYNSTTFHSYCHIENGVFNISKDDMPDWWEGKGFQPATKEQRDHLFEKMRESGYVWNSKKKELREIEDESENYKQQIMSAITDLVTDYIRQKPAWSEEDDAYKLFTISAVEDYYDKTNPLQKELVNWLKSLKDRVQHQNRWKPSKEQIIALRWVLNNIPYNKHKEEISGLLDQIKDL